MSGKVYDIDAAVTGQRTMVRLRGQEYPVADMRVERRITLEREYRLFGEELSGKEERGEEITQEEWDRYKIKGVNLALDGVPEDVAKDLSEREFEALRNVVARERGSSVTVEAVEGN